MKRIITCILVFIIGVSTLSPFIHIKKEEAVVVSEPMEEMIDRRDYWKEHPEECPFVEISKANAMALVADAVCPKDASDDCRIAVMACVWNRVNTVGFPNTIEEVAEQPYQWEGMTSDSVASQKTSKLARELLEEWQGEEVYILPIPSNCVFMRLDYNGIWFRSEWNGKDEVFIGYEE